MTIDQSIRSMIASEMAELEKRLREEWVLTCDKDLSFTEACKHLNMSAYTLRQLIREKRIPHRVYGSPNSKNPRYLFSQRRLDQWKREEEERNYQSP